MANPWHSNGYRSVFRALVERMDPVSMREECYHRGLISRKFREELRDVQSHRNERLLVMLEKSGNSNNFEAFIEILAGDDYGILAGDDYGYVVASLRKALHDGQGDSLPNPLPSPVPRDLPVSVAYERAIERGGVFFIKHIRVTSYGDCGVGKTCFFLAMQDQPHPDEEVSTECAALSSVICLTKEGGLSWEPVENPAKVTQYVQQMVASHASTAAGSPTLRDASSAAADSPHRTGPKVTQRQLSAKPKPTLSSLFQGVVSRVKSASYVSGLVENVERGSFHLIRMCDMAGQDMYRTLQDVLVCPAFSVYTVVIDASKPIGSPCSPAMMRRVHGSNPVSVSIEGQSKLDYLIDCLLKLQNSVKGEKCKVYLVGSKIDLRPGGYESVKTALEKDKETIRQRLRTSELNHLVPDGNIFFVDNTRRTSRCADSLPSLRQRISQDAEELVKIPLTWLLFTLAIMELAKEIDMPWISVEVAEQLAMALGSIDRPEDLADLLSFQHALGYVLYFPSAPDYVVVKVDLVMKAIAALIVPDGLGALRFFPERDLPNDEEKDLYDSGVLMADLAARIWRHYPDEEVKKLLGQATESSESHRSAFYKLMQAMHITCNIGKQTSPYSGLQCSVMLLPSVADQTIPVDRSSRFSHPPIAIVTEGGQYFPLPLAIKVATRCLSLYYCSSSSSSADGKIDLTTVQMRKREFRLPWSSHDSYDTFLILTYFRTGLLLDLQCISQTPNAESHVASMSDAKDALAFVKSVLSDLLPTVKMVEKATCPCVVPATICTPHEKRAGCDKPDCFHLVTSMARGRQPMCPYSKVLQIVSSEAKCWLGLDQGENLRLQLSPEPVLPSCHKNPWDHVKWPALYGWFWENLEPQPVREKCTEHHLLMKSDMHTLLAKEKAEGRPLHNEMLFDVLQSGEFLSFVRFLTVLDEVNNAPGPSVKQKRREMEALLYMT